MLVFELRIAYLLLLNVILILPANFLQRAAVPLRSNAAWPVIMRVLVILVEIFFTPLLSRSRVTLLETTARCSQRLTHCIFIGLELNDSQIVWTIFLLYLK